jgi:hypothetical protein
MYTSPLTEIENKFDSAQAVPEKMKSEEALVGLVQFEGKLIALLNDHRVPIVDVLDMLARYPGTPKEFGKKIARLVRLFTPDKKKEEVGNQSQRDGSESCGENLSAREEWFQNFGDKSVDEWLA